MHASEVTPEAIERANALYWDSDHSVNQIAEELDLSKGALYAAIEPQTVGLGCPLCGDEVGWANRTAKEKESLTCPTCEWDGTPDEAGAVVEEDYAEQVEEEPEDADAPSEADLSMLDEDLDEAEEPSPHLPATRLPPPPPQPGPSLSTIAGGALIGAAVGLALVLWARRR